MNKLIVSGNLGKDATKNEVSGKTVINFAIAVTEKVKDQQKTIWFDCSYWSDKAGILPYLVKGTKVLVDGKVGTREHDGKTYLTINVREVELVGGKQETTNTTSAPATAYAASNNGNVLTVVEDDDLNLPF